MARSVVGLFDNRSDAEAAFRDLESAGFGGNNVSFIDTATSQLASGLVRAGIPEADASIYVEGVQRGGALIVLQAVPDDQANRAASILDQHNVVDISRRGQGYRETGRDDSTSRTGTRNRHHYEGGDVVVPIVEEEVRVGKREVESGGVQVTTRVEEQPVEAPVTLREERVDVERRPVDRPASQSDLAAVQQGTLEVRERREEPVVDKEARVVEEVAIGKDVSERTETIQDTARRTDVDVEDVGGRTASGSA